MIVLQVEKVWHVEHWDWLGTQRNPCHKYSLTLWSHPYGNYCAAYNEFFGEFTCCLWAVLYKQNSKTQTLWYVSRTSSNAFCSYHIIVIWAVIQHGGDTFIYAVLSNRNMKQASLTCNILLRFILYCQNWKKKTLWLWWSILESVSESTRI